MRINVHAGHGLDGKLGCGAVGLIKESTEARKVVTLLVPKLKSMGHKVFNCTVDNGTDKNDILRKIVTKCNINNVDLDISIHFNSGVKRSVADGITTGTECYVYNQKSVASEYAEKICKSIADLGYRNRGVKTSQSLYFLNNTKAQAVLVECCFVDDADDVALYNAERMAQAIADSIGYADGYKQDTVEKIPVIVEGNTIMVRGVLIDGTNYIAIRDIAEDLGYKIGNKSSIAVLTKK